MLMFTAIAGLAIVIHACSTSFKPLLNSQDGIRFKVTSLAQGKEISRVQNKPLFVFVHASWCPTCKKMESEVLNQKEIGAPFNAGLVNVAIDVDGPDGTKLKQTYPIRATPTLFFFNTDGSLAKKIEGFTSIEELRDEIQSFRAK